MGQAEVDYNKILAGLLTESDNGEYTFRYDDKYFQDSSLPAISLTLPKTKQEYRSATLFAFFFNMLSEGANKAIQCQTLRIDEEDYFGLLLATAHTDTIGAVTVKKI
jgi:serine/threonine-protein kinase HipA